MRGMFSKSEKFNRDLGNLNSGKATDMGYMFKGAKAYTNHNMTGWNVPNVSWHSDFIKDAGVGNTEPKWIY
jgi:hypothetical protein